MNHALGTYAAMRDDYEEHLAMTFERAERACKGILLNKRGVSAGISALSLFYGNEARAYAYASDELIEHWQTHPRVPVGVFEQQWFAARGFEQWQ